DVGLGIFELNETGEFLCKPARQGPKLGAGHLFIVISVIEGPGFLKEIAETPGIGGHRMGSGEASEHLVQFSLEMNQTLLFGLGLDAAVVDAQEIGDQRPVVGRAQDSRNDFSSSAGMD